ncbi:MAG: ROK family protein, partial [Candidatus Cryptobacteroides sp.]
MVFDRLLLLDVGGTFIKTSDGREIPVDSNGDAKTVSHSFRVAVRDFCNQAIASPEQKFAIGVAIPGPFDYVNGVFRMTHKYASVYGEDFRSLARIPSSVELRFTHDVNCMLAGEMAYGNGRGFERVALVSLGTGLGYSMSIRGEILKNEFGSPLVTIFKYPCRGGILEDYVSKRGFVDLYFNKTGKKLTVKEIADAARAGDTDALDTFSTVAGILCESISPILEEYKIECLLFGGQISRSFDLMATALQDSLTKIPTLRKIEVISDFDNATFNGLRSL